MSMGRASATVEPSAGTWCSSHEEIATVASRAARAFLIDRSKGPDLREIIVVELGAILVKSAKPC
jgi:hypothetical protein